MGQMQAVGKTLFAHVREKAGEDVVGGIVVLSRDFRNSCESGRGKLR